MIIALIDSETDFGFLFPLFGVRLRRKKNLFVGIAASFLVFPELFFHLT